MKKTVLFLSLLLSLTVLSSCSSKGSKNSGAPHEHSFGDWTAQEGAICGSASLLSRACECGETESMSVDSLSHDLGEWVEINPVSCSADGAYIRACQRDGCEYFEEKLIEKLSHSFGEWILEREASCFEERLEARYCSVCHSKEERLLGTLEGHTVGDWSTVSEPSCSKEGSKIRYCSCGESEEAPIDKLPHEYGEWQTKLDPSCTKEGVQIRYCECGASDERHTEKVDHTFGEWETTLEPSCNEQGLKVRYCNCGQKEQEILPFKHNFGEWVETASATCVRRGKESRRCTCGEMETRYTPRLDHNVVIDPAVKPTVNSTGLTEGSHCSECKLVIVAQEILDKLPTPTNLEMLSFFSYEGYSDKLVFYWKATSAYEKKLKTVRITVNDGSNSKTYSVPASDGKFEFTPANIKTNYGFSAVAVDNNGFGSKELTRVCYWNPQARELSFARVEITTLEGELPTYTPSGGPSGTWGGGIKNANYVQSLVSVYDENNSLLYRSSESDFEQAKIKVRGNTSARSSKEPFKIKLNKKADLLAGLVEREDGLDYRDKNWLLLKTGYDPSLALGYTMSRLVGREYSPAYRYVSLFVNGDFRGLYVLMESVDDGDTRCNISNEGYIIEMDAYYWNEPLYFTTPVAMALPGVRPVGYTFKKPEDLTANSPEVAYIKEYMTKLENALLSGGDVSQYLDIQSCAEWLLVHDLISTWDSGGSNMYLTKYDNTDSSIVKMGPNWDFDSAFWSFSYDVNQFARIRYNDHFYMYKLVENAEFKRIYKELYNEVRDDVMREVRKELSKLKCGEYDQLLRLENERWGSSHKSFSKQETQILSWFTDHLAWMDGAVSAWIK